MLGNCRSFDGLKKVGRKWCSPGVSTHESAVASRTSSSSCGTCPIETSIKASGPANSHTLTRTSFEH